ncbi:type II inositol polyphosphate 5-phosphatase 15 isoform X2 [Punica granatum]|uniref:Type II inositol polyphosphate 5-phosphatase 15 isoform X2 n=1 Tax=Punica granatum TaxID=22663 RepID=A0A218XNC2_PUNGR|nr:type II inositol polyphosphate 5-phosphatase 15 isoform X2 [Punica granatum]OWM86169.1 hypothetical protein CDL15_Pgr010993 [Punica granatum]
MNLTCRDSSVRFDGLTNFGGGGPKEETPLPNTQCNASTGTTTTTPPSENPPPPLDLLSPLSSDDPMEAKFNGGDNFDLLTGSSPDSNPLLSGTLLPEANSGSGPRIFSRHFDDSSSSSAAASDDDEDDRRSSTTSMESTTKRLDYMLQFLDRKLSSAPAATVAASHAVSSNSGLPEFIGRGGGTGIFKLPPRAAVHPGRPSSLEVRPHPLRETQIGCFLRTIVATPTHLWAGGEQNLRVWDLTHDLYSACNLGEDAELDTAPFRESVAGISPTLCMASDEANHLVWSGHRDGRIRCWKMPPSGGSCGWASSKTRFGEALCWQGHRGPILSIAISSFGDLWSGSESGSIKIWPWEAIEKSLLLTEEERHIAVSSLERSYIEPRNLVNPNGFAHSLGADVKHLLSDHSKGRMWSGSHFSFALWDARTRELLRVFNIDGQVESRAEVVLQDLPMDLPFGAKRDKVQTPVSFFQRSRNALIGAADVVRRAATKGAFGDDNRKTEALVSTADGMIWTGCTSGSLIQWDGNGNRLQDVQYCPFPVQCLCSLGLRIWVGYGNGTLQVLDLEGNLIGSWTAHSGPVMKLTVGAGYVFSLASHGGIRGWNVTSPGPLDGMLGTELGGKEFLYSRIENVKVLAGTWNVGQGRASRDSLIAWLGSAASAAGIVVVGLQEVEMGAGFLAMSAAKETVGLEGSAVGQWWLDMIGKTLDEGSTFERIGSRQLAGLLVAVWVRKSLRPHAGDADAAAVPCGFGRAIGNKGAVGLRIRVYDRIICFINCHFAAHIEAVTRRNADFDHVYRTMTFSKPSNSFSAVAAGASSAVQMIRGANVIGAQSVEGLPELSEADMVIFFGDFNYRLDGISYDEARDFISQRCFDWLREKDQLRGEMEAGNVFQGMREAIIKFPPTYKFERHLAGLAGYDSGEKKRIPAWCDRILYRDSRSLLLNDCSLDCPVAASVTEYEACMDVTDSDHKPVRCTFSVDIARIDESVRRQEFGEVITSNGKFNSLLDRLFEIPETIVSTNNIIIQNEDTSILRITNKSRKDIALFQIICDGVAVIKEDCQAAGHHPRGSFGFPPWLEVSPVSGTIEPDHTVEVLVRHEKFQTLEEFVDGVPQNGWCEDTRDKEVILVIRVGGTYMTRTKSHRVRVRHCSTSRTKQVVVKPTPDSKRQAQILQRSDIQRLSDSYEVVEHLRNLHSP